MKKRTKPQRSCVSIPLSASMKKRTRINGLVERFSVSNFRLMDLPTAVLHEILFRLPVNSIIEIKFVCSALYKLISNPDFAVNYTKISPFATFLVPTNRCNATLRYQDLNLVEVCDSYECIVTTFKPKIPGWSINLSGFSILGTCNGLLCLLLCKSRAERVYISNPITGECMPLPERKTEGGKAEYGFGFCTSTNNYKVLRVLWKRYPEDKEAEIFTIGIDDTWRGLANSTIPCSWFSESIIAVNGALHWIVLDYNSTWICTFDLGEEKIGRLSHPHGLVLDSSDMKLISINNQICLVDSTDHTKFVIWKMKEYAVAESWTKDMILDISFIPKLRYKCLFPETILRNGDILFSSKFGDVLILYNHTKEEICSISGSLL